MLLEVCVNSLESAHNAQNAGADRIELCVELGVGGVTPSYGLLKSIKEQISIPVHVLIRPRSGDFTYSSLEFEIMKQNIALCVDMGFEGIVSGILNKDFTLDVLRTQKLIEISEKLSFTFHRAFDWVKEPFVVLEQLEDLGVNYILSSGQKKSSLEGLELLVELQKKAKKTHIMPGGGITPQNVHSFKEKKFQTVHLSGVKFKNTLNENPEISLNSLSLLRDDGVAITSLETIRKMLSFVK